MSDLDLMVTPRAANQALDLLRAVGCEPGYDLIRDDFFPTYHYEVELFTAAPRRVRVDLHARPFRPLRVAATMPDDALMQGARTVRIGEAEALVPRPEFMLIHLAAHAAFHGCSRLLWLYDIQRFVEHTGPSLDWTLLTRAARRWRLSRAVCLGIARTHELLEPCCPSWVLRELQNDGRAWRDRWTLHQAPRDATSPLLHVACNLICTPGWRLRSGYVWAHLFPGPGHLASLYPFRHRGWVACARAWRGVRGCLKLMTLPAVKLLALVRPMARSAPGAPCGGNHLVPRAV